MGKSKGLKIAQTINNDLAQRIQDSVMKKIRKEQERNIYTSINSQRALRRNKINQFLTKCNKERPEQRIENTKAFVELLCKIIVKEWTEITKDSQIKAKITSKPIAEIDIDKFVNGYSVHVQNLIKFDNEMVYCSEPKYSKSLVKSFLTSINAQLPVLHSKFANLVLEKEENMRIAENIREA